MNVAKICIFCESHCVFLVLVLVLVVVFAFVIFILGVVLFRILFVFDDSEFS